VVSSRILLSFDHMRSFDSEVRHARVLYLAVPAPQHLERLSAHCQYTQLNSIRPIKDRMQKSFEVSGEKMITAKGLAQALRKSRQAAVSPARDFPTPLISANLEYTRNSLLRQYGTHNEVISECWKRTILCSCTIERDTSNNKAISSTSSN